jgi:hypothetical protein
MNRNLQIILTLGLLAAVGRLEAGGITNVDTPPPVAVKPAAVMKPVEAAKPMEATNAAVMKSMPMESAPTTTDAKDDFQSFRLIQDRNIFDMSRTGRVSRRQTIHIPKVDDFTLVGTMSYEKGNYAFFDGSSFEYRGTRKPAEQIAGYKVAVIASDYVDLQGTNNKTVRMPVGTTIRREDNGPWSAPAVRSDAAIADSGSSSRDTGDRSDRSDRRSRRDRGSRGGSSGDAGTPSAVEQPASATSSAGGSDADVIKRLMEKRAKEVKDDQ